VIYLWVDGKGLKEFEVTNTAELEKRKIIISDGAVIRDGATIGDGAVIGAGATPIVIYIIGSRFPVSYWGEDRVDIGCHSRSIDDWLNDSTNIAMEYDYTIEQVEEYRGYVEFIKSVHSRKDNSTVTGEQTGGKA
jgi:hypothetical protein